jgi:hypothetical protein
MASPTELAREAMEHSRALRQEYELLKQLVESGDLPALRDRLVLLEGRVGAIEKFEAELRRIGVLEDRVNELKKGKEEADKRRWQFVYIFAGAVVTLLVTVVVQLVLALLKKP